MSTENIVQFKNTEKDNQAALVEAFEKFRVNNHNQIIHTGIEALNDQITALNKDRHLEYNERENLINNIKFCQIILESNYIKNVDLQFNYGLIEMKIFYSDVNMFVNSNTKGSVVKNIDVIHQSFYNILTTAIGSRFRQPTYGSYLPQMLQQQLTLDVLFTIKGYALQAISTWEPRVIVIEEKVTFTKINDFTVQGYIPYEVPEYNISNSFNGTFVVN